MASRRRNRCGRTTSTRRTRRKPFSARLPEERAPSPRDFFSTLWMCGKKCCRSETITKESERGKGIGKKLPGYFIEETAKSAGCRAIILESCIPRTSAHRFYESSGFEKSPAQPSKLFKNNRKAASPNRRLTTTAPAPRAQPSFFHAFSKFFTIVYARALAPTQPDSERENEPQARNPITVGTRTRACRRTLAPTKPNLEREKGLQARISATVGTRTRACRRTLAPTKPNLERKKICKRQLRTGK